MSEQNLPTPERIFHAINGIQSSAAVKAGLELGLFTALGRESKTAGALSKMIGASERGMRILCDFLVIGGLLEKEGAEYRSSPDAALFLDENSSAYFGSAARFLLGANVFDSFSDVAGAVRKGGTLLEGQGTVEPDNPMWAEFARSMVPLMKPSAEFISDLVTRDIAKDKPFRVLDVAAGHGLFGIEIATRHPKAEVVALDWTAVLDVVSENAEKAGVADRLTRLPGNAFDVDFGEGHDVALLTNFLHHFNVATCTELLRKVYRSLNYGGRAVTLEFVPNKDRVSPPQQASFALSMLVTTVSGDAYTYKQLESMAADAGFARSELHRMQGLPQSVVVSTK